MPAEGGDETTQLITWAVAGIGIGINLLWNWWNFRQNTKLAQQLRAESFEQDRWARLRNRIETRLEELLDTLRGAPSMLSTLKEEELRHQAPIDFIGSQIVLAHDALSRSLEAADKADFCSGTDWATLALGNSYGKETSWDLISTAISVATEKSADRITYLKRLKRYSDDIEDTVRTGLDQQDAAFAPN